MESIFSSFSLMVLKNSSKSKVAKSGNSLLAEVPLTQPLAARSEYEVHRLAILAPLNSEVISRQSLSPRLRAMSRGDDMIRCERVLVECEIGERGALIRYSQVFTVCVSFVWVKEVCSLLF
jgi:hypothetical protein